MTNAITEKWMKDNEACKESYPWFRKQKNKDWQSLSSQLYKEQHFDWCFWLLYRKTTMAKIYLWSLFTLSLVLSSASFLISIASIKNNFSSVVVIAAVAAAFAFVFAFGAAVDAAVDIAGAFDVVAFAAVAAFVVAFVVAFAFDAAFAFVVFTAVAFIVTETKIFSKIGCKISMRKIV